MLLRLKFEASTLLGYDTALIGT